MHRYYVSFSFQGPSGLGIASLDVTAQQPISNVDDLAPVTAQLTSQGYTNVKILAFSLYAKPNPDNNSRRNPNPNPNRDTRRNPNPNTSRKPSPRGRHS